MTTPNLSSVVLAVSAFRSDDAVIELLERAYKDGAPRFGAVIVVDSLGSGKIRDVIAARGWDASYFDSSVNLGSAGNLERRLKHASETGLEWCLALNHDAELDHAKALRLVEFGQSVDKVGAVYPRMRMTSAGGKLDRPRHNFATFGLLADPECSSANAEVSWSSSNGALYRLDAIREGVTAWPQLWMGYEDLAIGWELKRRGWRQLICDSVTVDDNYEFRPVRMFGRTVHVADKPTWYAYYQLRNLALISRATKGEAVSKFALGKRALVDFALLALRKDRAKRARLLVMGLIAGLRGQDGKGMVP